MKNIFILTVTTGLMVLPACTHTVRIEPSDKPILINLNVHITQDIRVKLDKDVESMLDDNPDIF